MIEKLFWFPKQSASITPKEQHFLAVRSMVLLISLSRLDLVSILVITQHGDERKLTRCCVCVTCKVIV